MVIELLPTEPKDASESVRPVASVVTNQSEVLTKVSPLVDKVSVNCPLPFAVPVNILCTSSEISLKFLGLDFGKGNTNDCCTDSFNTALLDSKIKSA